MPTRVLPDSPSIEVLRKQAKSVHKLFHDGDPEARALVTEFDPRASTGFPLANAQLVIARSYGFPSWPRLREHVQIRADYTRWPESISEIPEDPTPADLLRLGCLNYTDDAPEQFTRAREVLAEHPELAAADACTMAATGAAQPLRELLARQADRSRRSGGPFDWDPLCYLTYSRIGSTAETAGVLLAAAADPNSGWLWHGMPSPFTALAGAFGGGERDQPPHPEGPAIARLLLEAGADPNDNQALYNRMFRPENDHLELLFEFGLGTDVPSPWRQRLDDTYPSPAQMLQDQLRWAAGHGMAERVRVLLEHGVDPDGTGCHPAYGQRSAYQLAVLGGHDDIARQLADAGASVS